MIKIDPETADPELIDSLRQGNQNALSILYDRYSGLVYTLALKILARKDEAEDLTHEVFLSFWKEGKYDSNRGKLSSYLCILARSRAIDRLRSQQSEQKSIQRFTQNVIAEPVVPSPLDLVTLAEEQILVQQSLAALTEQQRQILELSYFQNLSQSEIATKIDLPLGTVKTHMRQGLIKLRQLLQSQIG
jgi:RNA polymerase sigma-70 factor, ECF subfamily